MSVLTMDSDTGSFFVPSREQGTTINMLQGIVLGVILTALSYWLGIHMGWISSIDYLEVFAVFTSYVCTFLCVVERRINYPIGAVSTAAYCILFFKAALFSSMAINGFLTVYLIYGWYRWKSDAVTLPVTRMNKWSWVGTVVVTVIGYVIVAWLAATFGGALVWTDAFILIGTIAAQFMMDNKKIENWAVWFIVDVFGIYTYYHAGLTLAGFQYIFFLLNTVYGYYMWRKNESRTSVDESTAAYAGA